jgi:NADH:ubiquinone reductase (H+-translocating)
MSRFTLARDFRRIDPRLARIMLVEAGPRILPSFSEPLAARAVRDLEALGVQVWENAKVTAIGSGSIQIGGETLLRPGTTLWAAGVRAAPIAASLGVDLDRAGRVPVTPELTLPQDRRVFVLGDMACLADAKSHAPLPGTADVAMQQGIYAAGLILKDQHSVPRVPFRFRDWGHFATIGRSRALYEKNSFRMARYPAWWFWLLLHIYRLTGFRSRLIVLIQWAWSYWTYGRGARLIVNRDWRQFKAHADQP